MAGILFLVGYLTWLLSAFVIKHCDHDCDLFYDRDRDPDRDRDCEREHDRDRDSPQRYRCLVVYIVGGSRATHNSKDHAHECNV
jgi:hypothetical protein